MIRPTPTIFLLSILGTACLGLVCAPIPLVALTVSLLLTHPSGSMPSVQGQHVVVRADVSNNGPDASGPIVRLADSSRYELAALQASSGFCFAPLRSCFLDALGPGESGFVEFALRLVPGATSPVTVGVDLAGRFQDANPSDNSDQVTVPFAPSTLVSLSAGPPRATLREGDVHQLSATAFYDQGPPRNVTNEVTWTTFGGAIVSVDGSGLVTALPGSSGSTTTVEARLAGQTATVDLDVSNQVVSVLIVSCADRDARVAVGESTSCRARVVRRNPQLGFSSFTEATHLVSWNCIGPAADCRDTPPNDGVVECLQRGNVTVEATLAGQRALWPLECVDRTPVGVAFSPPYVRTSPGAGPACADLTVLHADGSFDHSARGAVRVPNLTNGFPSVLQAVNAAALCYTPLAQVTTTLDVRFDDFGGTSGSLPVTVEPAVLGARLEIQPRELFLAPGESARVSVSLIQRDRRDISFSVPSSADPGIAQVFIPEPVGPPILLPTSTPTPPDLHVHGGSPGTTRISVVDPIFGITDSIPVTVKPVQALIVEPLVGAAPVTIQRGGRAMLGARLIFADGTERDVTQDAFWTSSEPEKAPIGSIVGARPAQGMRASTRVLGHDLTSATITATLGDQSASLQVNVVDIQPTAVFVSGQSSLKVGTRGRTFVGAPFDDGSFNDITDQVLLESSDPNVLATGNGLNDYGTVYGLSPGLADVFVQFGGVSGSQRVVVHDGTLIDLAIQPNSDMTIGETRFFSPVGAFQDGLSFFTQDLSLDVICTSRDENVITMSNAPGHECYATARQVGTASVGAEYIDAQGVSTQVFLPIVVK